MNYMSFFFCNTFIFIHGLTFKVTFLLFCNDVKNYVTVVKVIFRFIIIKNTNDLLHTTSFTKASSLNPRRSSRNINIIEKTVVSKLFEVGTDVV